MFSVETYFIVVQNTSIGNQNNKICQPSNPTEGTPLTGVWDPALFPPYFHWNLHTAERVKSIKLSSILWENVSIHFCIMGSIDAPESCVCSCPTVSRGSPGYRDRINRKHRLPCLLCMKQGDLQLRFNSVPGKTTENESKAFQVWYWICEHSVLWSDEDHTVISELSLAVSLQPPDFTSRGRTEQAKM